MSFPLSRRATLKGLTGVALALPATVLAAGETYRWRNVKVGGGGFIPSVVFSRVEKGLAYLRSDMGGAYRWDAQAGRWIPLLDNQANGSWQGVESVAPDPVNADVVYLACGMGRRAPAAILRSDNRGTDWSVFETPFRMGGNEDGRGLGERLAIDPNDTRILYFGSRHDGLQRSADRGATWQKVPGFPLPGLGLNAYPQPTHGGVSFVVFDPRGDKPGQGSRTLFVGVADPAQHRLWRSDDAGQSWTPIPTPHAFIPCKAELDGEGRLYVTYSNGIGPNGVTDGAVWRLDTATNAWTDITPAKPLAGRGGGFMGVSVDRQRPGVVTVSSLNRWDPRDTVWRSTDAGDHWTSLETTAHRDVSATPFLYWGKPEADLGWWMAGLAIDPFDSEFACYTTGATIYATREFSKVSAGQPSTWFPWVEGIEQTAIITLTSLPQGPSLLSGFGDISGFVHDDLDVSPSIQFTTPVFGNTNNIDYAGLAPNVVVRSGTPHQREGGPTLAWSADHGRSWKPLVAPRVPEAPPPPTGAGRRGKDPHEDAAIVVSADGGTFMVMTAMPLITRDRGATWTPCQGLPFWTRPVPDRADPQRFYAVDFASGALFVSQDGGATFAQRPTRGLPDIAADEAVWREDAWPLQAVPGQAGELWFVSKQGLFRSRDGGTRFVKVGGDLVVEVLALGAPPLGRAYPALYAIGRRGDLRAIWRSDDEGRSWIRNNDDRHEYGRRFRCLAADQRVFGRVYVGTDGRGIVVGDIAV
jgi:hypothetical protein